MQWKYLFLRRIIKKLDENLKKRFFNIYKFPNEDINKFILLLQKGVNRCEYMDGWKKFNETSLSETGNSIMICMFQGT